jgi:hypothetical protein
MKTEFTTAMTEATTAGITGEEWGASGEAPTLSEAYDVCTGFTEAGFS